MTGSMGSIKWEFNLAYPTFCSAPRCAGPGFAAPVSCAHPSPTPWTRSWAAGSAARSSRGSGRRSRRRTARSSLWCPQEDWGGRPTGSVPFQASWLTSYTLPGSDRRWRTPHRDCSSLSSGEDFLDSALPRKRANRRDRRITQRGFWLSSGKNTKQ